MRPTFRADLTCSREEQQGVVFYRIDDPKSQTSFRLYEIEYLIAKKLDGSRDLPEVIGAVKGEFNFDISEPDLQRFVNQLESMGFLHGARGEGSSQNPAQEAETQVIEKPRKPVDDLDLLDPADDETDTNEFDRAELDRLLRSAFLHVKQGYVVHARDYFLAAKELSVNDDRLVKLVNHLEIIGDASGPAEVEYLWNQARELFPEIAAEVGELDAGAGSMGDGPRGTSAVDATNAGEEDLRSRVVWTLATLAVVILGVGGLYWVVKEGRMFESAPRVRVATLRAEKLPVYFDGAATAVKPVQEKWLKAEVGGKIEAVRVEPGGKVEAGAVIASMGLPGPMKKKLEKARRALKKAEATHAKAADKLSKVLADREEVEADKATAQDKLRELRPGQARGMGGVSKRDFKKWQDALVTANKKLSKLAKKSRKPEAQEKKARKKRDAAAKKLEAVEKKIGPRLVRAPFAGTVEELKVKDGSDVKQGAKLAFLRDSSAVRLTFSVGDAASVHTGGEAFVSVGRGTAAEARILEVQGETEKTAAVRLTDSSGAFAGMEPGAFRLVREYVDPAFRVPVTSIVDNDTGSHVVEVVDDRALVRIVSVLQKDAADAVIRDPSGTLQGAKQIVVARLEDDGTIAGIADGAAVVVQGE